MPKLTTSSIFTLAIALFIVSLPIILISSIVRIVSEIKRVRKARMQGEQISLAQPLILAESAVLLFILLLLAAGAIYAGIMYHVVASNLFWVSMILLVLALISGLYSFYQRVNLKNDTPRPSESEKSVSDV